MARGAVSVKAEGQQHGGRRRGAGRRPMPGGPAIVVTVRLQEAQIDKIEAWAQANACRSFSAALRAMIDAASP